MTNTTCTAAHDHANAFALHSALENEAQELADESGPGDARRCPRHPHVKTSSDDGLHDGLCGACEFESESDEPEDLEAAAAWEADLAARKVAARAAMDAAAAEGDAYIPF